MPTFSQWLAFVIASVLFIQVPGPSLLFTIGRALTVGRRDALLSVVGNASGVVAQALLIAAGLGAVVAASARIYTGVKIVGAVYVIYLGVQAIRHRGDARAALERARSVPLELVESRPARRSLRIGATVGVTNPKTLVFFLAFLPQFVNEPAGHPGLQLALLGLVFGAIAIASDSVWAIAASRARDWFARRPTRLDTMGVAGGVMMIGLGAALVATD